MDLRKKLFLRRDPYKNDDKLRELFLSACRDQLERHIRGCEKYARIAEKQGFRPGDVRTEADLAKIPVIPTLYLKRNALFSVPESELAVKAASSGTSGAASTVGLDKKTLSVGVRMMIRFFSVFVEIGNCVEDSYAHLVGTSRFFLGAFQPGNRHAELLGSSKHLLQQCIVIIECNAEILLRLRQRN